jgi:hypothetical protein
MMNVAG